MIRHIKRYLAVRSYMHRLCQELVRRFGRQSHYSVENVTQAVQRGGLSAAFIAYAHAAYCTQEDFDAFYRPSIAGGSYLDLRRTVARRYFSGRLVFDAATIIRKFCPDRYSTSYGRGAEGNDGAASGGGV